MAAPMVGFHQQAVFSSVLSESRRHNKLEYLEDARRYFKGWYFKGGGRRSRRERRRRRNLLLREDEERRRRSRRGR